MNFYPRKIFQRLPFSPIKYKNQNTLHEVFSQIICNIALAC